MSFSKVQREESWNVEFFNHKQRIAGVLQRGNSLRIADIAYELNLCLVFDKLDDDTVPWQPALLLEAPPNNLIVLDTQDNSPFPTPATEVMNNYEYIFHSSECARPGDPHSLSGI